MVSEESTRVQLCRSAAVRCTPDPVAHRMPFADAFRAAAIVTVIAAHTAFHFGIDWTRLGSIGVDCFFVLSGFLLAPPFLRAILDGKPFPSIRTFWARRFLRIWPLYAASIAFSVVTFFALHRFMVHSHRPGTVDVLAHVFMLHGFFPAYAGGTFNGPLWTMAVDAQFYFLLPLGAWLIYRSCARMSRSRSSGVVVGVLLVITIVSLALRAIVYAKIPQAMEPRYFSLSAAYARNVVGMGSAFALGITVALANLLRGGPGKQAAAAAVLGVAAIGAALVSGTETNPVLPVAVTYDLIGASGAALILYGVGESQWQLVTRLVHLPFVAGLATLAYGLYLFHVPVEFISVGVVTRLHLFPDRSPAFGATLMLFFVPSLLLIALLGHRFVEKPFLSVKERLRQSAGAV